MSDQSIYPQLSGVNWPSNVLQAWLTLHALGVPAEQIRFLPSLAHFTTPEVTPEEVTDDPDYNLDADPNEMSRRHPRSPVYDPETGRMMVTGVDPAAIRPRLKVSIRSEGRVRFYEDAQGVEHGPLEQTVGRLAHFLPPLLNGLTPDSQAATRETSTESRFGESPLERLVRQIGEQYPELLHALSSEMRNGLNDAALYLDAALAAGEDMQRRQDSLREAANTLNTQLDLAACQDAWMVLAAKLDLNDHPGLPDDVKRGGLLRFRAWADVLFLHHAEQRLQALQSVCAELDPERTDIQRVLLRKIRLAVSFENYHERVRVVRELIEIMTSEAFMATAVSDMQWGLGWVHGQMSDLRADERALHHDGLFMSVTGGLHKGDVMQALIGQWVEESGFLGVGAAEQVQSGDEILGRERLEPGCFDAQEQEELWSLCTYRRETPDPILLLELALRRLIHPEARVELRLFADAHSMYGTLLAQPGSTAVMGGKALLQYPGALIYLPLVEDADEEAVQAKARLQVIKRLFLPVSFRSQTLWQEAVARLDVPTYLHHEFQRALHLSDTWAAMNPTIDEAPDPAITG